MSELYNIKGIENKDKMKKEYRELEIKLKDLLNKQDSQVFYDDKNVRMMFDSLSVLGKNLFRYHAMLKPKKADFLSINGFSMRTSWDGIQFNYWGPIDKNAFKEFDIDDDDILDIMKIEKINPIYFANRPVKLLYQYDKSYLDEQDELDLWRYDTELMKERFEFHFDPDGGFEE